MRSLLFKKAIFLGVFLFLAAFLISGCGSGAGGGAVGSSAVDTVTFTPYPPMPSGATQIDGGQAGPERANLALSAGWSTISFPYQTLVSTLGFVNNIQYYDASGYQQVDPNINATRIDCLKGYWALTSSAASVQVNGGTEAAAQSLTLQEGWNLIAFPRTAAKNFSDLTLTLGSETRSLAAGCNMDTEAGSAWLYGIIQYYKNNRWYQLKYDNGSNQLKPWVGYWVFSWQEGLQLNFVPPLPPAPVISSLTPNSGAVGATVTVAGSNFGSAGSVTFNGTAATQIRSWGASQIICQVPAGAASGDVTVTVGTQTSNAVNFTVIYIPPPGDYYVDVLQGSDANDGSLAHPFKTVTHALSVAAGGKVVCVAAGTYTVTSPATETFPLSVPGGVKLRGGYNSGFSARDPRQNQTILDANLTSTVVSFPASSSNNELSGFVIQNGHENFAGGIICNNYSSPLISNCLISGNSTSADWAGGIYCWNSSTPLITGCVISNNTGVGIYPNWSTLTSVSDTVICGNSMEGMYLVYSKALLTNCLVCGNSGDGIRTNWSSVTVTNCTVCSNVGRGFDFGWSFGNNTQSLVTNCIVCGNSQGYYAQYTNPLPGITYSDVFGNPYGAYDGCGAGAGCSSADPLFVNTGNGDYHLRTAPVPSPCINAGTLNSYNGYLLNGSWGACGSADITPIDMGYHYLLP